MIKINRKVFLWNYVFIVGITLLVLNDHILKWEFHNWFTGKFSDFLGMLILPLLITFFNPKRLKLNLIISGLLFMFWKSSLSSGLINWYNEFAIIRTSRVVDYTDYLALMMLPLAYFLIQKLIKNDSIFLIKTKLNSLFVLIPTIFILISESPPKSFYLSISDKNFRCHNCNFTVSKKQNQIIEKIEEMNIDIINKEMNDAVARYNFESDSLQYYQIERLILGVDTLKNIDISMINKRNGKTEIYFNGFDYDEEISNLKMKRKLSRFYRKLAKEYFRQL